MHSFLFNVNPNFCIGKLKPAINQNVAQTEENQNEVRLWFSVGVVELPIKSVTLNGGECPEEDEETDNWAETEEDLPGSVLVRVDKHFDIHNYHDCCENKVAVQSQTAELPVQLFSTINCYES